MDEPDEPRERRPNYKFDNLKQDKYLDLIRQGVGRHSAARAVGLTPQAVCEYANREPSWKARVSQAEMEQVEAVEAALMRKCLEGNPSSIFFYLQNRAPDRWRDCRAPSTVVEQAATPEQIREQLARLLDAEKVEPEKA